MSLANIRYLNISPLDATPISGKSLVVVPAAATETKQDILKYAEDWFFTPQWQKMITRSLADLKEGRFRNFDNADDMLAWLSSDE